jgi:hypothetical protein
MAFFRLIAIVSLLQTLLLAVLYNGVVFIVVLAGPWRVRREFATHGDKVGQNCALSLTKYLSLQFTV